MRQLKISASVTNRESDSLNRYLQEISKVAMIEPEEEQRLALRIKEGDESAIEKLTKANLRFVVSVAKQYQNQGLSLSDLINEGNLGLIKAAGRFDHTRGFKFISYAVWWIRQSISQALAEQARIVRVPQNKQAFSRKIYKKEQQLTQEFEYEPSTEEIAEAMGLTVQEVDAAHVQDKRHVSIDAPFNGTDEDSSTLLDDLADPNSPWADHALTDTESLKEDMARVIEILKDERMRDVLKMFFGIDMPNPLSLDAIAAHFDMTKERARQIKEKAIRHFKAHSRVQKLLEPYL